MKLLMTVTDGYEEVEAIGTLAILRRAGLDVTFASLYSSQATGRYGVHVDGLVPLSEVDVDDYDMLIIPGGPEYVVEEKDPSFLAMVKKFFEEDKYVAAICAGPTILGHLGLLKGRRYTCFVVDGRLITGRSCAASIDFALAIVETLLGKDKADRLKESIYY